MIFPVSEFVLTRHDPGAHYSKPVITGLCPSLIINIDIITLRSNNIDIITVRSNNMTILKVMANRSKYRVASPLSSCLIRKSTQT